MLSVMVSLWCGNFVVAKVALREVPVLGLTALRVTLGALILWPIFLLVRPPGEIERLRRDWKVILALGFFGVTLNQFFFLAGLKNTSAAHSSLLISLSPVFVLLIARLHRLERLTFLKAAGVATALAGTVLLTTERAIGRGGGSVPTSLGDFYALLGAVAFAYFAVLGKEVAPRYGSVTINTVTYTLGALMLAPGAMVQLWQTGLSGISAKAWLALLYMAGGASVAAYIIFYYALRRISATRLAALSYLQPVIVTLMGAIFLREQVTGPLVAGAAAILGGVYMTQRG